MTIALDYVATPSVQSTTSGLTETSAAYTFEAGRFYILFVAYSRSVSDPAVPSVVTNEGGGIDWTRIGDDNTAKPGYWTVATPLMSMTAWWGIGDGQSHTVTVSFGGANKTGAHLYFVHDTSGEVDTDDPIVQVNEGQGDDSSQAATTLATFANEENAAVIFALGNNAAIGVTAEDGWTEFNGGTEVSHSQPAHKGNGAFRIGPDLSPSLGMGGNCDWGCIAMEVRAAPTGGAPTPSSVVAVVAIPTPTVLVPDTSVLLSTVQTSVVVSLPEVTVPGGAIRNVQLNLGAIP